MGATRRPSPYDFSYLYFICHLATRCEMCAFRVQQTNAVVEFAYIVERREQARLQHRFRMWMRGVMMKGMYYQ